MRQDCLLVLILLLEGMGELAGGKTYPEDARLQEQRERPQRELPEALVRLAAVERQQRAREAVLLPRQRRRRRFWRTQALHVRLAVPLVVTQRAFLAVLLRVAHAVLVRLLRLLQLRTHPVVETVTTANTPRRRRLPAALVVAHVQVQALVAPIRRLRAEEEQGREQHAREDGDEVEGPLPADAVRHDADDDGREEGAAEQREVAQRHALAALVHEVQVADARVDERLEGRQADALEDARPQQAGVVVPGRAAPRAADDQDDGAQQEGVALAPDARRGHEQEAGDADAEQVVARQQGHVGEVALEFEGEGQGVGGEQRGEGRGDDGEEREDEEDDIALPEGPILWRGGLAVALASFWLCFWGAG